MELIQLFPSNPTPTPTATATATETPTATATSTDTPTQTPSTPSGQVWKYYYYAGSQRVAVRVAGSSNPQENGLPAPPVYEAPVIFPVREWAGFYTLGDHLGSTSLVADSSGNKVGEMRYLPWGETRYDGGTTPTDYHYTGQREEAGIGLYYYNTRWYDAKLGRFAQADTVIPFSVLPGDYDRYMYCRNHPINNTDPSGHGGPIIAALVAFVGTEVGAAIVIGAAVVAVAAIVYISLPEETREDVKEAGGALLTAASTAVSESLQETQKQIEGLSAIFICTANALAAEYGSKAEGKGKLDTGGDVYFPPMGPFGPLNRKPGDNHPEARFTEGQFGRHLTHHMTDWGLDVSSAADREIFNNLIMDIRYNFEMAKVGQWYSYENALFFMKDGTIVVTQADGTVITIIRDALQNKWWVDVALLP